MHQQLKKETLMSLSVSLTYVFCEAQGKGRARGGPRKVTQRSFIDGGWWMVDILSLMLYTKFGCHPPPPTTTTTGSLNKWLDEPVRGHVRLVKVKGGM